MLSAFIFVLGWALNLDLVVTSAALRAGYPQVHSEARMRTVKSLDAVRRALSSAALSGRDESYSNSSSFDVSFDGVTLFSSSDDVRDQDNTVVTTGVSVVCTTCYIKGQAKVSFTIDGNFDIRDAFNNVTTEVESAVENITSTFINYVKNNTENSVDSLVSHDIDIDDYDLPPLYIDFDIDVPDIPECEVQFQFDDLELYVQMDTIFSAGATYTLPLYELPFGVTVRPNAGDLFVGIAISFELILGVEAPIDISSGFHILLDDGLAINIAMFGQDVSSITFNGGHFEFLPVTLRSESVIFTAVLRIGAKLGLKVNTNDFGLPLSAGVEGGVFMDIAQFTTNITAAQDGSECELSVTEEYALLLGAQAAATIEFKSRTWGPEPTAQTSIFYTTLASACAVTAAPSATALAVKARDGLTESTITTKVTYTATMCQSTGLINCPASLQSTIVTSYTTTIATSAPSGSDAALPAFTTGAVSTVAFGTKRQSIVALTGSPVTYIPPTSSGASPTAFAGSVEAKFKGSNHKVVIGVCLGVVLPLLIAIIVSCVYYFKRKRYTAVQKSEPINFAPYGYHSPEPNYFTGQVVQSPEMQSPVSRKRSPKEAVFEIPRKPVLGYRSVPPVSRDIL